MKLNRKQIKAEARAAMRESKPSIFLTTLVLVVIVLVLEFLVTRLQHPGLDLRELLLSDGFSPEDDFFLRPSLGLIPTLLVLIISMMEPVLDMGFRSACLHVSRRNSTGIGALFDGFGFPFKVLWLNIVMGFFISLWSLLLIVPGFVAAYRYSMAQFILLDDPEKGILQCIRESKAMTRGHKMELFVMHLSFLGWILLSAIPGVLIFTLPYLEVTTAVYYNYLAAPVAGVGADDAPTPPGDDWWAQ